MSYIRPEVEQLIKRGNITLQEYKEFRGNSWEQEAIIPALSPDALLHHVNHCLQQARVPDIRPARTYNDALALVVVPELLSRYTSLLSEVENLRSKSILIDEEPVTLKSDIVKDICQEQGIPVTDHKMSESSPEDFIGIPAIKKDN